MKRKKTPQPVLDAAKELISSFGTGFDYAGITIDGYEAYFFDPDPPVEIGAVCFLYKPGKKVITKHGRDALDAID